MRITIDYAAVDKMYGLRLKNEGDKCIKIWDPKWMPGLVIDIEPHDKSEKTFEVNATLDVQYDCGIVIGEN